MMPTKMLKFALCFFVLTALPSYDASAQAARKDVIGVLDMQTVMRDLIVVKDINIQIKKFEGNYKSQFEARENALKAEKEQIERQKILITSNAYSKKQSEFNKKAAVFRRDAQEKARQIQQSKFVALEELRGSIIPVIQEIMVGYGATLVIDRSELLFTDRVLDKTSEIVEQLNEKLTKVDVKLIPLKKS